MTLPAQGISWFGPKVPVSGLGSLHLYTSQISEENLGTMLLATPSLKSLDYDAFINVKRRVNFDCARLGNSSAYV